MEVKQTTLWFLRAARLPDGREPRQGDQHPSSMEARRDRAGLCGTNALP
jgi:hypothetical protein